MAFRIIIDGYNFLWQEALFRDKAIVGFDKGREALLQWLVSQRILAGFDVTVVFDAHKTGSPRATEENFQGIHVVYTAGGQTADDLIRGLASQYAAGAIIVSSDREVSRHAEKKGCGVLGSREFQMVLERPEAFPSDPARRFSKAKRRALSRLQRDREFIEPSGKE